MGFLELHFRSREFGGIWLPAILGAHVSSAYDYQTPRTSSSSSSSRA